MPFQELSDSNPVDQTISDCKVKAKLETAKKPTPQFEANLSDSAYIVQTEQPQSKVFFRDAGGIWADLCVFSPLRLYGLGRGGEEGMAIRPSILS
jgi:hypothetical protein